VAKGRIVILTDPCARHGRQSRRKTFNGFKVHVLGGVVSGLIASVSVAAGNHHDGSVVPPENASEWLSRVALGWRPSEPQAARASIKLAGKTRNAERC
jgi:hypothetical protein